MPIVVEGSASFAGQILQLLGKICPCRPLALGAGQRVEISASDQCECDFGAGTGLVSKLAMGSEMLRIVGPCCNSTYSSGTLFFCPDQTLPSCLGECDAPLWITLAHELIHALVDLYRPDLPRTEVATARAENQIRREHGLAPRCCYSGDPVPIDGGFLDEEWIPSRPDCPVGAINLAADIRKALWTIRWTAEIALAKSGGRDACGTRMIPQLAPEATRIDRLIARARVYRNRQPFAAAVDRALERLSDQGGLLIHLERIVIDSGVRSLILHSQGGQTVVIANVGVDPAGPRLVPLGAPMRFDFAPDDDGPAPIAPPFPVGNGGDPEVYDGAITWLEVRDASASPRRTAYYGLRQTLDRCTLGGPLDGPDRARWEAVEDVWARWVALSERTPVRVSPLQG